MHSIEHRRLPYSLRRLPCSADLNAMTVAQATDMTYDADGFKDYGGRITVTDYGDSLLITPNPLTTAPR
jgi:hypothetical protein